MKPRILISTSKGTFPNYENAVTQAGGIPCACHCPGVDLSYDGLLLSGGDDIDPIRYGQENRGSEGILPDRDEAELALIAAYLSAGKPILGICRGEQVMNVALGGTLIQDLSPELRLFHSQDPVTEADRVHPIRAQEGAILHRLYGGVFPVNSTHHQVVDQLGRDLRVTARSEAGLVEALEHRSLPVLCVQFHPERMAYGNRRGDTVDGALIFDWFIAQCIRKDVQS